MARGHVTAPVIAEEPSSFFNSYRNDVTTQTVNNTLRTNDNIIFNVVRDINKEDLKHLIITLLQILGSDKSSIDCELTIINIILSNLIVTLLTDIQHIERLVRDHRCFSKKKKHMQKRQSSKSPTL